MHSHTQISAKKMSRPFKKKKERCASRSAFNRGYACTDRTPLSPRVAQRVFAGGKPRGATTRGNQQSSNTCIRCAKLDHSPNHRCK
jgi:hypothetical protein